MSDQVTKSDYHQEQQTNPHIGLYTSIWLITTALLAFGPKLLWDFSPVLNLVSIVVNLLAGALLIRANIYYLRCLDKVSRKIFVESATITLGVLMVFGVCYELVFFTGIATELSPRISHLYFVMGGTFILSTYIGNIRYRAKPKE